MNENENRHLEAHPHALIFPNQTSEEFESLKQSIEVQGLIDPIALYDQQILDGRHRYRACLDLDIEPRYDILPLDTDTLAYVIAKNLNRRHLSESQRALIAARMVTTERGGDRKSEDYKINSPIGELIDRDRAAALFAVGARSVDRALYLLKHGDASLIARIDADDLALGAAEKIVRGAMKKVKYEQEKQRAAAEQAVRERKAAERARVEAQKREAAAEAARKAAAEQLAAERASADAKRKAAEQLAAEKAAAERAAAEAKNAEMRAAAQLAAEKAAAEREAAERAAAEAEMRVAAQLAAEKAAAEREAAERAAAEQAARERKSAEQARVEAQKREAAAEAEKQEIITETLKYQDRGVPKDQASELVDQVTKAQRDSVADVILKVKNAGEKIHVSDAGKVAKLTVDLQARVLEESNTDSSGWLNVRTTISRINAESRDETLHDRASVLPAGKYQVLLADPPWRYSTGQATGNRDIENHYPTMPIEDILALGSRVQEIADDDAILYLWATPTKCHWAFQVMDAWGFEYQSQAVWVKEGGIGMGFYWRNQHELLLTGTRGKMQGPLSDRRVSSVISAPRLGHSEKPQRFYEIIESHWPGLTKVELFARQARVGWAVWGNEVS